MPARVSKTTKTRLKAEQAARKAREKAIAKARREAAKAKAKAAALPLSKRRAAREKAAKARDKAIAKARVEAKKAIAKARKTAKRDAEREKRAARRAAHAARSRGGVPVKAPTRAPAPPPVRKPGKPTKAPTPAPKSRGAFVSTLPRRPVGYAADRWQVSPSGIMPKRAGAYDTPLSALLLSYMPLGLDSLKLGADFDETRRKLAHGEPIPPVSVSYDTQGGRAVTSGGMALLVARELGLSLVPCVWTRSPVLIQASPEAKRQHTLSSFPFPLPRTLPQGPQLPPPIKVPAKAFAPEQEAAERMRAYLGRGESWLTEYYNERVSPLLGVVVNQDGTVDGELIVSIRLGAVMGEDDEPIGEEPLLSQDDLLDLLIDLKETLGKGPADMMIKGIVLFRPESGTSIESLLKNRYNVEKNPLGGFDASTSTYWFKADNIDEFFITLADVAENMSDADVTDEITEIRIRLFFDIGNERPGRSR